MRNRAFQPGCASSNLLRCVFARTLQDYRILAEHVNQPLGFLIRGLLTAHGPLQGSVFSLDSPAEPTIHFVGIRTHVLLPIQRQTLKHLERDNMRAGRLAALFEETLTGAQQRTSEDPYLQWIVRFGSQPVERPASQLSTRVPEPAAKPLALSVDSYDSTVSFAQQLGALSIDLFDPTQGPTKLAMLKSHEI